MRAERELGVSAQLIMCFLRDWSAEFAMATLLEGLQYKEWIVGVGELLSQPMYCFSYADEITNKVLTVMNVDILQTSSKQFLSELERKAGC